MVKRFWNWIARMTELAPARAASELRQFRNAELRGGFVIEAVTTIERIGPDALGRPALAHTMTIGRRMVIVVKRELSPYELSVSLYHEVLEAATVGSEHPPESVHELNEAGFDDMARRFHAKLGPATIQSLNQMLKELGF